ncbi:hypothetical protein LTR53_012872 [Teratosphaeriaceae sp. CCFEE 6253]|nr:hypothetical protein LTR53_012872 [Teratosphaeriaceae sp. CCFEE 6253]
MAAHLEPVMQATSKLQALLEHARQLKHSAAVDPPLPVADLINGVDALRQSLAATTASSPLGIVETASRQIFYGLIQAHDITSPSFVEVWNLLDILIACGDRGAAGPELVAWLVEELLDAQTTTGCRIVFNYLESRRERLAAKDFHKKNLVFLRLCNELLRRLSRAEDAIFCGRVFFFLFQTFPLGDKSSVNLRGEFHVENTTSYSGPDGEAMEVDGDKAFEGVNTIDVPKVETPQPPTKPGAKATPARLVAQKPPPEDVVLPDHELYPIFWRLQQDFSDPTRLFGAPHFATFKKGLGHTLTKFKKTPTVVQTKAADSGRVSGFKRKRHADDLDSAMEGAPEAEEAGDADLAATYNPKYLTSRDLFTLELSDLAFQRHIMVQSLILIDFLLSLTAKAKTKLDTAAGVNKSMLYALTLSADDELWCRGTRADIKDFLRKTPTFSEGQYYLRAVETVLARDKNWVRWKAESCPSIVRDPVSTQQALDARKGARDATRIRRVPERPAGSIDLSFLAEGQGGGLEALRERSRFVEPGVEELVQEVKGEKLDLEMAMDEAEQEGLRNAIAGKNWRGLRMLRAVDLGGLERVEVGRDLDEVFGATGREDENGEGEAGAEVDEEGGMAMSGTPEPAESEEGGGVSLPPSTPALAAA